MGKAVLKAVSTDRSIEDNIEAVHDELRKIAGALHITAQFAEKSNDDKLWGLCDLCSDGINRAKVMLCDVGEAVELQRRGLAIRTKLSSD